MCRVEEYHQFERFTGGARIVHEFAHNVHRASDPASVGWYNDVRLFDLTIRVRGRIGIVDTIHRDKVGAHGLAHDGFDFRRDRGGKEQCLTIILVGQIRYNILHFFPKAHVQESTKNRDE
jgi:hypothetical protein